jgi:tetratricopeptide (TPR) repeat protein
LASALIAQDNLAGAEAAIRRAAELDPSYRDALLGVGQRYEDRKQYAAAIAIYKQFPDNPAVRERLGNLLLEDGHPEEAIPHLEAVVKASPTPANRYALAIAHLRAGNAAEAEQTMQAALATDPKNSDLRLAYAGLLRDRKSFQAAAQQFYQVTQTVPDSKPAWTGFATMLLMLENYPQAVTAFDRLEALGEPNPAIYFFRALANDHLRQFKPALADYTKFLSLSKDAHPDEEFKARQRVQAIQKELEK